MKDNSVSWYSLIPKAYQVFIHLVNILELWPMWEDFVAIEVRICREEEVVRVDIWEVFGLVCIPKENGWELFCGFRFGH